MSMAMRNHFCNIDEKLIQAKSELSCNLHTWITLVEKLSFMTILCHFGSVVPNTLYQLGRIILNIHVTLDHFLVTLDISDHFRQCHKRPCFLLVIAMFGVSILL